MAITQVQAKNTLPLVIRGDKRATAEVLRSLVEADFDPQTSVRASTATIALAASSTTDGMDITITVKDSAGNTVTGVHQLEVWMSEDSTGVGLTADTYSGSLTASTGAILTALTAKKHFSVVTDATGVFEGTLVASANPADQYVAVKSPVGAAVVVSGASGTNWEGA